MAVWMVQISGGLERSRAKTVMPVPPGTALHQLYSVPPTVRALGSTASGFWGLSSDMLSSLQKEKSREKKRLGHTLKNDW